jgi:hypothetical protein
MNEFFIRLSRIDRRYIFLFVAVSVIIPLLYPLHYPTRVTRHTRAVFDIMDQIPPENNPILISFEYGPSTMPECHPMAYAILRHSFARKVRVIGITLSADATGLGEQAMQTIAREYGREYGRDYVFLGYKPGVTAVMLSIGEDLKRTFPRDYYGRPTSEIPMLAEVHNYEQIPLVIPLTGSATATFWLIYAGARYHARVADGVTAVMASELYAYLQTKQLSGMLAGLKGAAEYEHLIRSAGYTPSEGLASRGMDALSTLHLVIILFIILGNIGFFLSRRAAGKGSRS